MNFPLCKTFRDVDDALMELRATGLQAYSPTWTGASSNPAIGNGSLVARYWREQFTCHIQIHMTAGSTTTFGTGAWQFTVPLAPRAEMDWTGGVEYFDGTRWYIGKCRLDSSENLIYLTSETPGASSGFVQSDTPFVWGSGDFFNLDIAYPV